MAHRIVRTRAVAAPTIRVIIISMAPGICLALWVPRKIRQVAEPAVRRALQLSTRIRPLGLDQLCSNLLSAPGRRRLTKATETARRSVQIAEKLWNGVLGKVSSFELICLPLDQVNDL